MNRLHGWQRISLGVMALLAIPVIVEAHTLTGSGGWADELVCLVPALIMVALVLFVGRDGGTRRKNEQATTKSHHPPPGGSAGGKP